MSDMITLPRSVVEEALLALRIDDLALVRESVVALRAALEQPQVEQEPVAWAVMQGGAICWEADYPFSNEPGWCDSDQQSVPLYTQPQLPRQPLTDEWIRMIYDECDAETGDEFIFAFARAIEFAHGITGDQT